jgi:hypothetical protein
MRHTLHQEAVVQPPSLALLLQRRSLATPETEVSTCQPRAGLVPPALVELVPRVQVRREVPWNHRVTFERLDIFLYYMLLFEHIKLVNHERYTIDFSTCRLIMNMLCTFVSLLVDV